MSDLKHTPTPWHVYEGGNFIKIGAEGYDEYIKREHYLGGPLLVADVEDCATETHDEDHEKGMANAAFIVRAVNNHDALVASLTELVESPNAKSNAMWDRARTALALAKGERDHANPLNL